MSTMSNQVIVNRNLLVGGSVCIMQDSCEIIFVDEEALSTCTQTQMLWSQTRINELPLRGWKNRIQFVYENDRVFPIYMCVYIYYFSLWVEEEEIYKKRKHNNTKEGLSIPPKPKKRKESKRPKKIKTVVPPKNRQSTSIQHRQGNILKCQWALAQRDSKKDNLPSKHARRRNLVFETSSSKIIHCLAEKAPCQRALFFSFILRIWWTKERKPSILLGEIWERREVSKIQF